MVDVDNPQAFSKKSLLRCELEAIANCFISHFAQCYVVVLDYFLMSACQFFVGSTVKTEEDK